MSSNEWPAHNHGPSEGRGLDCGEKPIGWCVRDAKDDEIERLREGAASSGIHWAQEKRRAEDAEAEVARLTRLLEQRTAALTRTIDAKNAAEARLARVEALADGPNQPGAWVAAEEGDAPAVWVTHVRAALDGYRIVFSTQRTAYVREPLDGGQP